MARDWWYSDTIAFLDRMPENKEIDLKSSAGAKLFGIGVVAATIALYVIFR